MTAQGSLAYRSHEATIWAGLAPEKYTRLLPYIHGNRILEIGAAEGVLALLLADRAATAEVWALEQNARRHETAIALQKRWRDLGRRVEFCTMLLGDIRILAVNPTLDEIQPETVVAVRTIYHLGDAIDDVFAAFNRVGVASIVLCGNKNRAARAKAGTGDPYDFYAGVEGMTRALETAGYRIDQVVTEGDPIVTGRL